jgi:myo-inositol-1(or 4)-monophosphatase
LLALAIDAAREAGALLRASLGQVLDISYKKGDKDLVTRLDKESEALIAARIRAAYPDHKILAEEGTTGAAESSYTWIVDPLDGTTNYAHAFPAFAVSIAVQHESDLVCGAVFAPALDELYAAARGGGATLNGRPIAVSPTDEVKRALVGSSFTYDPHEVGQWSRANTFIRTTQALRNIGSAALELCYVADGRFDAYLQPGLSPWDMAAAALIVVEAGGKVTNFHGQPHNIHKKQIVASNSHLHDAIIAMLNPTLRQRIGTLRGGAWPGDAC